MLDFPNRLFRAGYVRRRVTCDECGKQIEETSTKEAFFYGARRKGWIMGGKAPLLLAWVPAAVSL